MEHIETLEWSVNELRRIIISSHMLHDDLGAIVETLCGKSSVRGMPVLEKRADAMKMAYRIKDSSEKGLGAYIATLHGELYAANNGIRNLIAILERHMDDTSRNIK